VGAHIGAELIGGSLYELAPGDKLWPYHTHHANAREHHTVRLPDGTLDGAPDWGAYTVGEAALRHGVSVAEETTDADVAYASWPEPELMRYRDGWLPG
jgi:hypothetical protein